MGLSFFREKYFCLASAPPWPGRPCVVPPVKGGARFVSLAVAVDVGDHVGMQRPLASSPSTGLASTSSSPRPPPRGWLGAHSLTSPPRPSPGLAGWKCVPASSFLKGWWHLVLLSSGAGVYACPAVTGWRALPSPRPFLRGWQGIFVLFYALLASPRLSGRARASWAPPVPASRDRLNQVN